MTGVPDSVLALAPERRAGWAVVFSDAGGLVAVTVPAVPGTGVPVLDAVMPLLTPLAATGEIVAVVVELLPDESFCYEVVSAVMRDLGTAGIEVDDPTYLRRARVVEAFTGSADIDRAPDLVALAAARGCPPNATEGQAMAVLLARPPVQIWLDRARPVGASVISTELSSRTTFPAPLPSGLPIPSSMDRLLTRAMLRDVVPVSDMTLWRWTRAGTFPLPVKFNGRTYWRAGEVQAWMEMRSRERGAGEG